MTAGVTRLVARRRGFDQRQFWTTILDRFDTKQIEGTAQRQRVKEKMEKRKKKSFETDPAACLLVLMVDGPEISIGSRTLLVRVQRVGLCTHIGYLVNFVQQIVSAIYEDEDVFQETASSNVPSFEDGNDQFPMGTMIHVVVPTEVPSLCCQQLDSQHDEPSLEVS